MEFLSQFGLPIAIVAIVVAVFAIIAFINRNYIKCPPNEVLVLYGRKNKQTDGSIKGFRVISGGAAFRMPILEQAQTMPLGIMQIALAIQGAPNTHGVLVNVDAIANVKISGEPTQLMSAVARFLGMSVDEIKEIIQNILEGNLRQIIGTLSIEDIVRDREKIAQSVLSATQTEIDKIGVTCDNFVIKAITDNEQYIVSLGAKKTAEVKRDATIGKAEADREAAVRSSIANREAAQARLSNEAQIADADRDLRVRKAEYAKEVARAEAEASLAGEIAKTNTQQKLVIEQANVERTKADQMASVAEKQAALKEKELIATQIKPAEAAREAARINAEAARISLEINADAAKRKAVIDANAAAEALTLKTNAEAVAARTRANAEADAMKARAEADKARLAAEGEGKAAADAAQKRQLGLAEAEVNRAKLLAEAAGAQAKGEAEGVAIRAKLLAEAEGIDAKNRALMQMNEGARLLLIMDRLPEVLDHAGDAAERALTPIAAAIGAGLAGIDEVKIIDLGGSGHIGPDGKPGESALAAYTGIAPQTIYKVAQVATALGIDLPEIAKKIFGGPKSDTPTDDKKSVKAAAQAA